jgi:hypothetical protein
MYVATSSVSSLLSGYVSHALHFPLCFLNGLRRIVLKFTEAKREHLELTAIYSIPEGYIWDLVTQEVRGSF